MGSKAAKSKKRRAQESFPVVGIGASAGGFDAATQLLAGLSLDTGMAFVVVLHLDPNHRSQAPEIFSRATAMPVHEIKAGIRVEPDQVYVIPYDSGVSIAKGIFNLHPRVAKKGQPKS